MSSIARPLRLAASALALAAVAFSPAIPQEQSLEQYIAGKPAVLQPQFNELVAGGQRDSVLNNMELASIALKHGLFDEAAGAIDRALLDIMQYYGLTEDALKARSVWFEEGSKTFKGEPYERAMANYYRGMLDLRLGDYDNARAAFANGSLQDAFAEEEQYRSDFAVLLFLAGWSAEKAGSGALANDRYAELAQLRSDFQRPPPEHDTLVVIETGKSPRKLADGIGHAELVYRRGKHFKDKYASVDLGQPVEAYPMEDLFYQASTRGGRHVDRILEGKINFREGAVMRGSALTEAATVFEDVAFSTQESALGDVAAGLSVVGSLQLLMAQNAKPRADTRYWSGLPDTIHVYTYDSKDAGSDLLQISYLDKAKQPLPDMTQTVKRHDDGRGGGLVWVLSQH
ncbi:hypothetical protein [Henriciella sp.]|uniref:hypothetical protein n=1 Tax=Henriciella sp. TaxID=1968823 RepID=UPI001816234E|nr:hypothetical protein [Henriciella sp.]HIG21797.1 hypothetical protein [Henriciella sp.]